MTNSIESYFVISANEIRITRDEVRDAIGILWHSHLGWKWLFDVQIGGDCMSTNLVSFFLSVGAGLFTGWLFWIFKFIFENHANLIIGIKSKFLWNQDIRLSISYLFRIKVNSKFLLIRGSRIDQFQPVGGVFKMLESLKEAKRSFEIRDDECIPIDETSKDDLRVRIKGKHLLRFLKWFYSRKNREVCVHREFYEELIKSHILSEGSLISFNPEYVKTVCTKIQDSVHFKCKEILIYEIYEVAIDEVYTKEVFNALNKAEIIILATSSEIETECINSNGISKKIGKHAQYIL